MPIKEAHIETTILGGSLGPQEINVYYSDEILQTSIFDLAYCSVLGGYLPYLFVGHFTNGGDFNEWFFSNARRHQEMRQAIEQDIGNEYEYTYGQMWFGSEREAGDLTFVRLDLHSDISNFDEAKQKLMQVIRPDLLRGDFWIQVL